VARRDQASWLRVRLSKVLDDVVQNVGLARFVESHRIEIGVNFGTALGGDLGQRDIAVALNAVEALSKWGRWAMGRARKARFYGLLPEGAKLAPFDTYLCRGIFGFNEVRVGRHGYHQVPVDVVFTPTRGGPAAGHYGEDHHALKRHLPWRNQMRNRRIATLATLLAAHL